MKIMNVSLLCLIVGISIPHTGFTQDTTSFPSGMFAELPHERASLRSGSNGVNFPVTTSDPQAAKFFQQGLAELYAGTKFEAARAFREVITRDPSCAMGYWGIAMAHRNDVSLATEYMWYAFDRSKKANPSERDLIQVYARHFGSTQEPEMLVVDFETGKRRAKPTLADASDRVQFFELQPLLKRYPELTELRAIAFYEDPTPDRIEELTGAGHPIQLHLARTQEENLLPMRYREAAWRDVIKLRWIDCVRQRQFADGWYALGLRQFRLGGSQQGPNVAAAEALEAAHRLDNSWLVENDAMPYERETYFRNLALFDNVVATPELRQRMAQFTLSAARHPKGYRISKNIFEGMNYDRDATPSAGKQKFLESLGPLHWTAPKAPNFALPKGSGEGLMSLADLKQPTIVVFYLGFGCIHCVEQLNELRPRYKDFKNAGIEIVAIGSDPIDEVKAAMLDSLEVDGPTTPFEILCDPKHEVFKKFHCWDEFTNEALHGTFLIDTEGRIRWRDISEEPFMDTDFLLKESQRLIAK